MNRAEQDRAPAGAPGQASAPGAPTIQLPKGGGAIHGMGEKFGANPVSGTASMTVPILTSPGRGGSSPQLTLSYDSGAGNGPFGFGWSLTMPAVTRKTDKGLPRYLDEDDGDVFILAGAEDLVPVYRQYADGAWVRDAAGRMVVHEDTIDGYRVRRYRPRIEGMFARIERWSRIGVPDDVHWRSLSKDNILAVYGLEADARIADPLDPARIFSWLICETRDDKGDAVLYRYKAEDGHGVDLTRAHERNRGAPDDPRRGANRYLKRVHYGNRIPLLDADGCRPRFLDRAQIDAQIAAAGWMFEVVFDYGEHDADAPTPREDGRVDTAGVPLRPWPARVDPFSSFRSGFDVRTARLCRRVLMVHHFPGEADVGRDCIVRSTDFTYPDAVDPGAVATPVYTFLQAVTQTGWRRADGGYRRQSLPPVEFEYTVPVVQDTVQDVDPDSLDNLPVGLDGSAYRWIDLHGEGVPGIVTEQGGAWYYKRNWSADARPRDGTVTARFAPLETVALMPNATLDGGADFMDLAADGQPDLVLLDGPVQGLYEHDEAEGWLPFRPFAARLNRDLQDPNLKFVDLDGDGRADVLITEDEALVWHPSLAEDGFAPARRVAHALDEEAGPRVVFADGTQSIYLADVGGDGLSDIVRVRNGEVCYWPNLGYGRFGAKVTMDNPPWFDQPDQFDQSRVRLADIDGSGTADLIYLHRDGVCLYFNQSGNGWSRPHRLRVFPPVDDGAHIEPVDLLGNGTACLVWSSPLPGQAGRAMRYVDLMGGAKPHLLAATGNNLGAETRIRYAPSTRFYVRDRLAGTPWVTRLPFPVHVVERVDTIDHLSRSRFCTRYAYHHGYFDGEEREFRGFGMVEQWDTEQFATLAGGAAPADDDDAGAQVPPVHTKTWFHTGVYLGRGHVSDYFAGLLDTADKGEYFREPGLTDAEARAMLLPDTLLPAGLDVEDEREACRALKGSMLRQEVYADDAGPGATRAQVERARVPYTVVEQNFSVRALQPRGTHRHGVFFTHAREAVTYRYERNAADPRIEHALTLEVDGYGTVLKQAAVAYGRRPRVPADDCRHKAPPVPNPGLAALAGDDRDRQTTPLLTYTEQRVTHAVDTPHDRRNPVVCEVLTFELTGYAATGPCMGPDGEVRRFRPADLVEPDPDAPGRMRHRCAGPDVPYEAHAAGAQRRRPIECVRTLYRRDDLRGLLPLGTLQARALPGESYRLAFTPGLLDAVFRRPRAGLPDEMLLPDPHAVLGGQAGDRGGYVAGRALARDGLFPSGDDWWSPSGRSYFSAAPDDDAAAELAHARAHFFLARRYRDPFGGDAFADFDAHDLLLTGTRDALGNRTRVDAGDYRVLQPRLVSDPNDNRTEVAFDTLGMVAGSAVMGKPLPARPEGDSLAGFPVDLTQAQIDALFDAADPRPLAAALLGGATLRVVYDLDRFRASRRAHPSDPARWQPACAATLARETHGAAPPPPRGLKIQLSFSYSDGFGREMQKKVQAEPGPLAADGPVVDPRWVGTGWIVFNNKGKSVRQYEPFFSGTHRFEFGVRAGVSPVLFYDPLGRTVATLHPDATYEKVVFDAWRQTTYDVNDTCAARATQTGDPRTDPDVGGYVAGYFRAQPPSWQTWHARRIDGALGADERAAALRAAAHADTPATAHLDVLGRPFLTIARNRVVCAGHDLDGMDEDVAARVELDIEGNQRAVSDERRRTVVRYAYDMLGNRIHQRDMDAGARWMLGDATGKPLRAWDGRGHNLATTYDALRRPAARTVRGTSGESDPRTLDRDVLFERIEYGEALDGAAALNLRTRVWRQFDAAGLATNARLDGGGNPVEAFDFKGNLLCSTRCFARDYRGMPDWSQPDAPQLEPDAFEAASRYDALNRTVQQVAPHAVGAARINVIQPVFNEANLPDRVDVWLERGAATDALLDPATDAPSPVGIANIEYDAKGQRRRIDYRNGASTSYDYDALTFRLTRLRTRRAAAAFPQDDPRPPDAGRPGRHLQHLRYTYDPVGNITRIRDAAQQAIFFRNRRVDPGNDYVYDALYQLIQASGREHLGAGGAPLVHSPDDAGRVALPHPGDGNALGTYVERYVYDGAGNLLRMRHRGGDPAHPGWSRAYDYREPSRLEEGTYGNRLGATSAGSQGAATPRDAYAHDVHGNMVRMPHLGAGAPGPNLHWNHKDQLHRCEPGGGGTAWFVVDAAGQRVRKVWDKGAGLVEERISLGGFELFRRHSGGAGAGNAFERETLHVMAGGRRVAIVETRTRDPAHSDRAPRRLVRYQLDNHLGSACVELDARARIVSYEEYAPFGSTTYQAVRRHTEAPKRFRFTGKERDEETGLYYLGARYYAPWLGRWTAADPAGLVDGPNLYRYARNCPVLVSDPRGTDPPDPRNYENFADFSAAAPSPYSPEYLQQVWQDAHPAPATPAGPQCTAGAELPVQGDVSGADQAQLAAAGVFFMPDNSADIGTPVHLIVLPILAERLAAHGVPNVIEMPTLVGGSKSGQSVGFIDLAVFVPPQGAGPVSMLEAHVYDLKPGGSSSGQSHSQQVENYVRHFDASGIGIGVVPQVGTALYDITARSPDILAPIEVPGTMGRAYIGLQLTAPGIIEYHLGVRPIPVPVPVPKDVKVEERRPVRIDEPETERRWFPQLPEPAPLTRQQQQQAAATTMTVGTMLIIGLMILGSPLGV